MRHPQLSVPIKTDYSTATIFVNSNIQLKLSKTWDIQLHWLRNYYNEKYVNVYWNKRKHIDAYYLKSIILLYTIVNKDPILFEIISIASLTN